MVGNLYNFYRVGMFNLPCRCTGKKLFRKGLVPDVVAGSPEFLIAVALGAAFTVMLATLTGFPISTTHSLTGALVGAGLFAVGQNLNFAVLGKKFFLPLLLSPFIALALAAIAYTVFRAIRVRLGITKEWCICLGEKERVIPIYEPNSTLTMRSISTLDISIKDEETCSQRYNGSIFGINVQNILDYAHF